MDKTHDILCIGSVLWDVIGRTPHSMRVGSDEPGRITRLPGGVAMNIAMTLRRFDLTPALLTAIGDDHDGIDLLARCGRMGMVTEHVHVSSQPTDVYMAVEGPEGLIAAVADAHSLEAAGGDAILNPLENGTLGSAQIPYAGVIALDGNLTVDLLTDIAKRPPSFAAADLRVAPPASPPGKARRLRPLMGHPGATLYVNREEAGYLTDTTPRSAEEAAGGAFWRRGGPHGCWSPMAAATGGPRGGATVT